MLLSIIIPVYNVDEYLSECLDSIASQNPEEYEIIIVNDGSTDNSAAILSEYKHKFPSWIFIHQSNKGLSGARNAGLDIACGDYVYFLDSDDFLLPNALKAISEKIATGADMIGFGTLFSENAQARVYTLNDSCLSGIRYFEEFYLNNKVYPPVNIPVYVFKRAFLNTFKIRFPEGYLHEDIHFAMLCFYYAKQIISFNIIIYHYRQHREGSISTNVRLKNLEDKSKINRALYTFFSEQQFYNKYFFNQLFQQYLFTLNQGLDYGYSTQRKHSYFTLTDKLIMRRGILSAYEFNLWMLFLISDTLGIKYYRNELQSKIRRFINITGGTIFKIMH